MKSQNTFNLHLSGYEERLTGQQERVRPLMFTLRDWVPGNGGEEEAGLL